MKEWDKLQVFYYVAKLKSITAAARHLKVSQPSVSRTITLLEGNIKTLLFNRIARGVTLTKSGEILYEHVSKVMSEITAAVKFIEGDENQAEGQIRILTTHGMAYSWLVFFMPGFLKEFPGIKPIITCEESGWDMTKHDVGILPYMSARPDLIQNYLETFQIRLYASPDYLKQFGTPQKLDDLRHHQLIIFGENSPNPPGYLRKLTKQYGQQTPFIQINSLQGRMHLAELGLGIAELGQSDVRLKNSNLVEVLPEYSSEHSGSSVDIYYTYHKTMQTSERVTALLKYFEKKLSQKKNI